MSWQERAQCDGLDTEIFFPGTAPGDDVQAARIARRLAKRRAQLQDDTEHLDESAILRRVDGDLVPLTRPERAEVIRRLRAKGLPDNEIGRRARLKVERYAPPRRLLQEAS